MAAIRQQMSGDADTFMKAVGGYFAELIELEASASQLQDRVRKIILINDVIDQGNRTQIATNMAQAERDPKLIAGALPSFDGINKHIDEPRATPSWSPTSSNWT